MPTYQELERHLATASESAHYDPNGTCAITPNAPTRSISLLGLLTRCGIGPYGGGARTPQSWSKYCGRKTSR